MTAAPIASSRAIRAVALAEGRYGQRDLAAARQEFATAAAEGDVHAARIHAGFLAVGIGGPRDWSLALETLRDWASRDFIARRQAELISAMDLTADGAPVSTPPARKLHGEKRIELIAGLFSAPECAFLMKLAGPAFQPATVFAEPGKPSARPAIRDNDYAAFDIFHQWPFVHAINLRIAAATGTDVRQGEPLQVMRYRPGQQYRPHVDGVGGGSNKRVLTAVTYLNADYTGGETAFTELELTVRGRQGDMVLWSNLLENGMLDQGMRHAGLPVTAGVKFIASRWILQRAPLDAEGNPLGESYWSI